MTLKIIHKNNTSAGQAPAPSDLDIGEIAVNSADAQLYVKDNDGAIQSFTNDNDAVTVQQFTQAGSGAAQRTVESKLQDVVSVLDFIPESEHAAIKAGTSTYDAASDIQVALDAGSSVYVPKGLYSINSRLILRVNNQTFWSDEKAILKWTGSDECMVDITAERPAGVPSTLTKEFITFKGFRLISAVGSEFTGDSAVLRVAAGIFHSTICDLEFDSFDGKAPASNIYFSSNGGQSYAVNVAVRDVKITNGLSEDAQVVDHGVFIEAGIEHEFTRVHVYNAESGFTLGTTTVGNLRNVANCTFFKCQSEIGDRGYAPVTAKALTINQARDCHFYACKIYVGADASVVDGFNAQVPIELSGIGATYSNYGNSFHGCTFWGQDIADYAVKVSSTGTRQIGWRFEACNFNGFRSSIVNILDALKPNIKFSNCTLINAVGDFGHYYTDDSQVSGFTINNAQGLTVSLYSGNETNPSTVKGAPLMAADSSGVAGCMMSAYLEGQYPRIRYYNRTGSSININTGGTVKLRVRSLEPEEIQLQTSIPISAQSISVNSAEVFDLYVPGLALGMPVLAGYTDTLDNMNIFAYASAPNLAKVYIVNRTGGTRNLPAGTLIVHMPKGGDFSAKVTIDVPSLAASGGHSETGISLPGVQVGDFVLVSHQNDMQGVLATATVTAADTVAIRFQNESGITVDLASGDYYLTAFAA